MKIIVFDDDPTGSQTVYNCPLLLKWDEKTLLKSLDSSSNLIFILTNTRALTDLHVKSRIKEISQSIKNVLYDKTVNPIIFWMMFIVKKKKERKYC